MYRGEWLSNIHRYRVMLATLGVLGLLTTSLATVASAGSMADGGHDFSINTAGQAETCVVCHAPSGNESMSANGEVLQRATWSLGLAGVAPKVGDGHGANPAVSFAEGRAGARPCLGCHDGSVAPDHLLHTSADLGGFSSSRFGMDAVIGKGHPVFVVYDALVARRSGLFDPATTPSGLGGTIKDDLLVDSQLVCSSCHGVHDQSGRGDFLRISNERSRLCLTCHDL